MPDYVCDSTRKIEEKDVDGIPVIAFEKLKRMDCANTIVIITAGLFDLQAQVVSNELYYFPLYHCRAFEAYYYLRENRGKFDAVSAMLADTKSRELYDKFFQNTMDGVFWSQSLFEPNPYFGNDCIGNLHDDACLVLAGAFNGKHIDRALANNHSVKIHGFEPNRQWYEYLVKKYCEKQKIILHNSILWNQKEMLRFDGDGLNSGLDAHVISTEDTRCDTVIQSIDLDSLLDDQISLIALDIEGSECRALQGAATLIKNLKPDLAICLYHNVKDFIEIPLLIDKLSGGRYTYHVKQHSCISAIETVLYAT